MKINKMFAYFITTAIYLFFCLVFLVWFSYTGFQFMLWSMSMMQPYSWWGRIPIILVATPIMLAITLAGAMPLFWIDKIKQQKRGWLGKLFILTAREK